MNQSSKIVDKKSDYSIRFNIGTYAYISLAYTLDAIRLHTTF
jgi:hypothetical protein